MCVKFNRNRAEFTKLVYETGSFDRRTIESMFSKKRRGDIIIDGSQTLSDYLEELTEYGALRYEGGKYHVVTESCAPRI
jgi:hypothetical protein